VVSKRNPGLCSPEIQTRRGTCRVADLTARYKLPAVSLPPAAVLRTNHISNHTQTSPGPKHKQHFSSQSPPSPEEDFAWEASTTGKPARPSFTRSLRWPASLFAAGGTAGVRGSARPRSCAFPLSTRPPVRAPTVTEARLV
jgi:hypothetical protein